VGAAVYQGLAAMSGEAGWKSPPVFLLPTAAGNLEELADLYHDAAVPSKA
jgi:hypothetical protein